MSLLIGGWKTLGPWHQYNTGQTQSKMCHALKASGTFLIKKIPQNAYPFVRILRDSSFKLEIGLEPTTPSLRVKCSTNWAIPARIATSDNLNHYNLFFFWFQLLFLFFQFFTCWSLFSLTHAASIFSYYNVRIPGSKGLTPRVLAH